MGPVELLRQQRATLAHWQQHKLVMDQEWLRQLRFLPPHVQRIVGPEKNLLLLEVPWFFASAGGGRASGPARRRAQAMSRAAGVEDRDLCEALRRGFPIAGSVPGVPGSGEESREAEASLDDLWHAAPQISAATLDRVARDSLADDEVKAAFDAKVREDVDAGRAKWVRPLPRS